MDVTTSLENGLVLSLDWEVKNVGLADLHWVVGSDGLTVHTTYLGDGLGSLMQAAVDLQLGSSATVALLQAEPAATWFIFSGATDEVYVQIVQFDDVQSEDRRWSGGISRWRGRVEVAGLISAVRRMAEEALARAGSLDRYQRNWGGIPFPSEKLAALQQA
ncbi:hypothetical protein [Micromonospora sp. NPDC005324]|uniref:hypothetical protein n=1 Tax=Micromonospora sp. NPDC005324 TaxID=3157033 RepID=UPI0033AA48B6